MGDDGWVMVDGWCKVVGDDDAGDCLLDQQTDGWVDGDQDRAF